MGAVLVEIALIFEELSLQIHSGLEEHLIQQLSSDTSYLSFHEGVRNRHMGSGLDFLDVEYSQICPPSMVEK